MRLHNPEHNCPLCHVACPHFPWCHSAPPASPTLAPRGRYARERTLRKEEEGRKARQAAHDRHHLDTTGLRKGRIDRLKQLCEADGDTGEGGRAITMAADAGAASEAADGDQANGGDGGGGGGGNGSALRYFSQVPDGAVKDSPTYHPAATDQSPPLLTAPHDANPPSTAATTDALGAPLTSERLYKPRQCYTCKERFVHLHHFYAALCPKCAALNYTMRSASADLHGRVALLTGARVKIGYAISSFLPPLVYPPHLTARGATWQV